MQRVGQQDPGMRCWGKQDGRKLCCMMQSLPKMYNQEQAHISTLLRLPSAFGTALAVAHRFNAQHFHYLSVLNFL